MTVHAAPRLGRRPPDWASWLVAGWLLGLAGVTLAAVFALWPVSEAVQHATSTGAADRQSLDLGLLHVRLTADVVVLMLAGLCGVLGSLVHTLTRLAQPRSGGRRSTKHGAVWYVVNPVQGGVLALLTVAAIEAGLFTIDGASSSASINLFTVAAFGGATGLFSKRTTSKLASLVSRVAEPPPAEDETDQDDRSTQSPQIASREPVIR